MWQKRLPCPAPTNYNVSVLCTPLWITVLPHGLSIALETRMDIDRIMPRTIVFTSCGPRSVIISHPSHPLNGAPYPSPPIINFDHCVCSQGSPSNSRLRAPIGFGSKEQQALLHPQDSRMNSGTPSPFPGTTSIGLGNQLSRCGDAVIVAQTRTIRPLPTMS